MATATSNQQPATTLTCNFNPDYWYFRHHNEDLIKELLKEKATIVGYFPSSKTILFELKEDSVGYKVWNVSGKYLQASFDGELLISQEEIEAWYKPENEVSDLDPADFRSDEHYWDTFGKSQTESFMRWVMIENQKAGKFEPIQCNHAHTDLCLDGLLTDFGDNRYLFTRKALRKLAGSGFYKPL